MHDPMYQVRPLASYVMGNLTMFMRAGAHRIRIDEAAALKLQAAFDRGEPADAVSRGSFVQLELGMLDALSWVADSRQPSPESESDRELRRRGGRLLLGGWLHTMYDLAPQGATFSVAGLVAWKAAALLLITEYPELDDDSRRGVLTSLCLLWDGVANPADSRTGDLVERLLAHQKRQPRASADDGEPRSHNVPGPPERDGAARPGNRVEPGEGSDEKDSPPAGLQAESGEAEAEPGLPGEPEDGSGRSGTP